MPQESTYETSLRPLPRVVITGSRKWTDYEIICRRLMRLDGPVTLIHGTADGADTIADHVGRKLGFRIERHPALWEEHGRKAGMLRNIEMLDHPLGTDLVLGFAVDLATSRGTKGCLKAAYERKLSIEVIEIGKPMQRHYWPPLPTQLRR